MESLFSSVIPEGERPRRLHEAHSDGRRVQILRDIAIGSAIDECATLFLDSETDLLAGRFDLPLIEAIASAGAWSEIIRISRERVYNSPRGVMIEAAGFEVLGGLLDVFVSALNDAAAEGSTCARSRKLLQLLPTETLGPERQLQADPYQRLLRILDFVSGMTDRYAVSFYQKVRGISLLG